MQGKKTIIVCASGTVIGGMEVLFSNMIRFLYDNSFDVILLTRKEKYNIYNKLLSDFLGKFKIVLIEPDNILYMSEKSRERQRLTVLSQMNNIDIENSYAVCGYFIDVQLLCSIFNNHKLRLLHIWPHPLNWSNALFHRRNTYNLKKRDNTKLYQYQRDLLFRMDNNGAMYYTSYAIFDYNKWYYKLNLHSRIIKGLPIQKNVGIDFNYDDCNHKEPWKILWVGRFDYYKIDAIIYIYDTLIKISNEKQIKFIFNIVGSGDEATNRKLKSLLISNIVEVNFWGNIPPIRLNNTFSENDIGIGMGVTVKQMGAAGLPAILIDSISNKYKSDKIANWLWDIKTGDDGDGMYYHIMGQEIKERNTLYKLLTDVLNTPSLLNEYSEKCKKHVEIEYSYEKQYHEIVQRILNSTFTTKDVLVYRHNIILCAIRNCVRFVRKY